MKESALFKVETFIPPEVLDVMREAIARAGGGRLGQYDHCLSATQVLGYWQPLEGAEPYMGTQGQISKATEVKIEVNCKKEHVPEVIQAIRDHHPYEAPLINIIPLANGMFMDDDDHYRYGP
jgi:hypothetical protein